MGEGPVLKPWYWRVRRTKYVPASAVGWLAFTASMVAMIGGISLTAFSALNAYLVTFLAGLVLAAAGFALLVWGTRSRAKPHPRSRWQD